MNKKINFPVSWHVLVWFANEWKQVWNPDRKWEIQADGFSEVYFETVKTNSIRLQVILPASASSGIAEWSVY